MPGALRRRPTAVIGMIVLAGVSMLYLRLWIIDYRFTLQDRELLRKQFDRASMEAMDESAEWRRKYDEEARRARHSAERLVQASEELVEAKRTLALLREENARLRAQAASPRGSCSRRAVVSSKPG